jgi:endo-1,4-beta-D-glucanase Y
MHIFSKDVLEKEKKEIKKGDEEEHKTLRKKLIHTYRGKKKKKEEKERREQEKKEGETQHAHLLKGCVKERKKEKRKEKQTGTQYTLQKTYYTSRLVMLLPGRQGSYKITTGWKKKKKTENDRP